MNLRQKAKKYKQRCKNLERLVVPTKTYYLPSNEYPIITLETSQIIDMDEYYRLSADAECYASRFNKIMAGNLIHEILNYAEITIEPFYDDKQIIKARMKVIDLRK